ncbi:MAG: hypothetical protein Q9188_005170 [Gyalolechia gomerana]
MEESDEDADSTELPELDKVIKSSLSAQAMLPAPSPPKKRRRINPSPALSKPFRSPFRTPLKTSSRYSQNTTTSNSTPLGEPSTMSKLTPTLTPTTLSISRRSPLRRFPTSGAITSSSTPSSHLSQLQKQHTTLLNELSSLRGNLDTTTQALEIEASTTDAELEALIRKWKGVSRNAAEAVFEITKERMDSLGGVKAWRKREGKMSKGWGWEEEGKVRSVGVACEGAEDLDGRRDGGFVGEDRKEAEEGDADGEDEVRCDSHGGKEKLTKKQEFSMEMMLRSLDIPLPKIGYDAIEQRWVD